MLARRHEAPIADGQNLRGTIEALFEPLPAAEVAGEPFRPPPPGADCGLTVAEQALVVQAHEGDRGVGFTGFCPAGEDQLSFTGHLGRASHDAAQFGEAAPPVVRDKHGGLDVTVVVRSGVQGAVRAGDQAPDAEAPVVGAGHLDRDRRRPGATVVARLGHHRPRVRSEIANGEAGHARDGKQAQLALPGPELRIANAPRWRRWRGRDLGTQSAGVGQGVEGEYAYAGVGRFSLTGAAAAKGEQHLPRREGMKLRVLGVLLVVLVDHRDVADETAGVGWVRGRRDRDGLQRPEPACRRSRVWSRQRPGAGREQQNAGVTGAELAHGRIRICG